MMNLNALGFEPGVEYALALHGYAQESLAVFEGVRWTTRGAEYLFRSTVGQRWAFGVMAEHLDHWTRLGGPFPQVPDEED